MSRWIRDDWTPEQAWSIYQFLEQSLEEIRQHYGDRIADYQWREEQLEAYAQKVKQMSEKERIREGVWLEPIEPDTPEPF